MSSDRGWRIVRSQGNRVLGDDEQDKVYMESFSSVCGLFSNSSPAYSYLNQTSPATPHFLIVTTNFVHSRISSTEIGRGHLRPSSTNNSQRIIMMKPQSLLVLLLASVSAVSSSALPNLDRTLSQRDLKFEAELLSAPLAERFDASLKDLEKRRGGGGSSSGGGRNSGSSSSGSSSSGAGG